MADVRFSAIRAQGSGGQKVNKVSSAVHLRFDIRASSLPKEDKQTLLAFADTRINSSGIIVIKAQSYRTQEQNREDALGRLEALITRALRKQAVRRATRPSKNSKVRRLDEKTRRGRLKSLRSRIPD